MNNYQRDIKNNLFSLVTHSLIPTAAILFPSPEIEVLLSYQYQVLQINDSRLYVSYLGIMA